MGEMRPVVRAWRRAAIGLAIVAAATLAGGSPAHADTTGPGIPFDAVVSHARLVVVGVTSLDEDGGVTIRIERVFSGTGPSGGRLHFGAAVAALAPELVDGGRAVIAFADPTTIDAAAPTTAWQVSGDGYVDPARLHPARDLPPTLAAMYTFFGEPMAAPRVTGGTAGSLRDALVPILLVLVALAAAEGGIARRERARR